MAAERNIDVRVRLKGADQFARGMQGVNSSLGTMGNWLDVTKGILGAGFVEKGLQKIIDKLGETVDKSIDFESAIAGVAKTTNFSDVGLRNFSNELIDLSQRIPMTASELAGLAEVAGQLGITEGDLLDFVEVIAAMGVSTNISAEEAATALARVANIFGTSAEDYSRLGSAVVDLGNNFATTESEIIDMAKNMSGMAAIVGMSEADVLAYAAALSSIGIEAAAGGNSMQKLFQTMELASINGSFESFAEVAGMTNEAFAKLWKNDPARAVERFLAGLGELEASGGSAVALLQEMEIKEVRLVRSILGLANAEGLLDQALSTSNEAWRENTALAEEAGKRYETTASRMQIAQNKIENAEITIGDGLKVGALAAKDLIGDAAAAYTEAAREINLADEVKKANDEFAAQKSIIDENAQVAHNIARSISEMGSVKLLDVDGQRDYAAAMQALITIIPEANKLWDEETLSIQGGTEALHAVIDATREYETAQAGLNQSRNAADAYAIVEKDLEGQRMLLVQAKAELEAAESAYQQFMDESAQNSTEFGTSGFIDFEERNLELGEAVNEAGAEVTRLEKQIAESEAALQEYAYVVEDYENAAGRYVTAAGAITDATAGISSSQQSAIYSLEMLETTLDEAIIKYQEAETRIRETLDTLTNGAEKIELPEIEKPESIDEALNSQLEFMQAYSDAIQKAKEMGVDESLLSSLADGTVEDYATLASIVSGTEEDVAAINAKYAEVSAAKTTLASELAETQTGLASTVEGIVGLANNMVEGVDVGNDMYAKGAADVQNLIDGINSKIASLTVSVSRVKNLTGQMAGTNNPDGSHAAGLAYVPHDNYIAQLHRGEMVLTALEAKAYRAEQFTNYIRPMMMDAKPSGAGGTYNQTYNNTTRVDTMIVREESDIDKIARKLAEKNRREAKGRGYM